MMTKKSTTLIALTFIAVIAAFTRNPIPQDLRYHIFADQRTFLALPNAVNVLSNIPFIIAGAWGVVLIRGMKRKRGGNSLLTQYFLFFAGVFLSGLGSSWYHLAPSNSSLFWDRLPMSIAFMALLSSVISENVSRKAGRILLVPLLAIGAFSVGYWVWTENTGSGDLRLYALVQFLPLILIPMILILYKPPKNYAVSIWLLAGLYVISKLFEVFDKEVFAMMGMVSGHTIKHVLAAIGILFVVIMVRNRRQELEGV